MQNPQLLETKSCAAESVVDERRMKVRQVHHLGKKTPTGGMNHDRK
jgi:hypothetical protein